MNLPDRRQFDYLATLDWLQQWAKTQNTQVLLDPERHALHIQNPEGTHRGTYKLPVLCPPIQLCAEGIQDDGSYQPMAQPEPLQRYLARVSPTVPPCLMLLLQAGQAALGFVEDDEIVHHKVIRKYMVRKKQGKAQLTHLKTKGKSRLGSRVRLQQSLEFFEDISSKLHEWDVSDDAACILYSASVRLWPLLFEADPPPPFDAKDTRLRRLPFDVKRPTLEELQHIHKRASYGYWEAV